MFYSGYSFVSTGNSSLNKLTRGLKIHSLSDLKAQQGTLLYNLITWSAETKCKHGLYGVKNRNS